MLVVFRHPGGYGDELCPGGLDDSAEGFGGEISHPDAFLHQFGDEGQGRIDVPEGAQRYECDMHTKLLSNNKTAMQAAQDVARTAAGKIGDSLFCQAVVGDHFLIPVETVLFHPGALLGIGLGAVHVD